jgi:mono/diheme cytochrome c family protein
MEQAEEVPMKNVCACLFIFVIGIMSSMPPAYAADGKTIFLNKCGSCHKNGGEASVFAPTKYASIQWERFFQANKHTRVKDISALVKTDESAAINEYLKAHAADSDQPEAVGLK